MKKNLLVTCALCLVAIFSAKAINFNNALRVAPGTGGNGHVAIAGLSLDTMDFTVEVWIKADTDAYNGVTPFNDPSIFGNKDWDHGTNTGIEIAIYTGGTYKVNFTPVSISRFDIVSSGPQLMSRWNHIAVSVERRGYLRLYTNGVLTDSLDISSGHGKSIDGSFPYNFCDDGTGSYAHPLSANVDEFRIWKGVRTTDQIRQYMCRTLPAGTSNMYVYYPLDQTTGTTVTDASGSGHNGTLTNLTSSAWVSTGAGIGNVSSYKYASSLSTQTVSQATTASGKLTVNNMDDAIGGIQVYATNYPPNTTAGIVTPGTDSVYFGVYPVSETRQYQVQYDYTGYTAAVTNETGLNLNTRVYMPTSWQTQTATKSLSANTMQTPNVAGYRHFVPGRFINTTFVKETGNSTNNISAFPNPSTNGLLTVNAANGEQHTLEVYNMLGAKIKSATVTNWPYTLDLTDMPAGGYILNCYTNSTSENFKINIVK